MDDKLQVFYVDESVDIKMAPQPFAEGGQRIAYFGIQKDLKKHTFFNPKELKGHDQATSVLKTLRHFSPFESKNDYRNMVECQAIANTLAKEFNSKKPKDAKTIKFLEVKLVEVSLQYTPWNYTHR